MAENTVASLTPATAQTFTGVVRPGLAAATTDAPRLSQVTSALTITAGTLPNMGAWTTATAKVNPVARQITVNVLLAWDGTANASACAIAISPDNTTYTTIGTASVSVAINTIGAQADLVPVNLPAGWYIRLTFDAHVVIAASLYY